MTIKGLMADEKSIEYEEVTYFPQKLKQQKEAEKKTDGTIGEGMLSNGEKKEEQMKKIVRSSAIYLEYADALTLKEGEEITLMNIGNVMISSISTAADGLISIIAENHPQGDVKQTEKKLTWISAHPDANTVPFILIELDTLIKVKEVKEDMSFEQIVRPSQESWFETLCRGESALREVQKGEILQLNRRGYFICDAAADAVDGKMKLILIPDGKAKNASILGSKVDKAAIIGGKKQIGGGATDKQKSTR